MPEKKSNKEPIGAVLVVGGGIGGMQAALDLAEAGIKVYLVESKSAIGGHMAQLDKTFPTNDCAMCIMSPKMVDVGRHTNIEVLTNTEVIGIEGEAGHFTAKLRVKPRYIDLEKCTGCGDCASVCPILLPSEYEEGLTTRHAAHRLYPQAIPHAFAIEKTGLAPCRDACPTGQRAQGYIALIREGRYEEALRVIKEDNPFPAICGRICNHRCEDACNRGLIDESVAIASLKRFVADQVYSKPRQAVEPLPRTRQERIAIVGAGPAGLTGAQDLVKLGYGVTVFEALPVAGGMLRVGVPEYRLPAELIQREVDDILDLGVELKLNTRIDNLQELIDEGYDAIFLAVGAHEGKKMNIPGADLEGTMISIVFLRDVRLGQEVELGNKVSVVGGGDVAVDAARTALRVGAEEVTIVYRRSEAEMPCRREELEGAKEEGIRFELLTNPVRVLGEEAGRVTGIECVKMELGEPDESGRRRPVPIPGTEHVIPTDNVIFSIGQAAGLSFIPEDSQVVSSSWGTIVADSETLACGRRGVFAGGDAVAGTAFVIEAVADGHRAAASIHRYLSGEELPPLKPDLPVVKMASEEAEARMQELKFSRQGRLGMPALPAAERRLSFEEVELGYTAEMAQAEAARCLQCGICSECLACVYTCQAGAINHEDVEQLREIGVGAAILVPGFEAYHAELSEEFGLGRYPNVVTSIQFERLLSASGPTEGHVKRPSDGERPGKIAFLQCIGSRDQTHDYCSSVCCMYATKEAIMACEHEPDTQIHVFMVDMRAFGKGYLEYYRQAQKNYGIKYTYSRISTLKEDPVTRNLIARYYTDDGRLQEESFHLVVLSVGMEMSPQVRELGQTLGIELDEYGFCHTLEFQPLETSRPGIFACGPFVEPKDIPETVVEASAAASRAESLLAEVRGSLTKGKDYPPDRDVSEEEPRIGVFVCHCGSNIGGFLDVPGVAEYAKTLPFVVHSEDNLYTCSQDSVELIKQRIHEHDLNRVVVASCTPHTHEPMFQDTIRQAGLNEHLFEMANIRNQCSWVHSHDWDRATEKAKELVRMSVARAALLEALHKVDLPLHHSALVIGGGVAGLNAALSLADQGFPVHLIERTAKLGGNLRHVRYTLDDADPQAYLRDLIDQVESHELITVYKETELTNTSGFVGNFSSRLRVHGDERAVEHGVVIVSTGGQEYRGDEYFYGQNDKILTQQEFEIKVAEAPDEIARVHDVVMILCVGPGTEYCSRICCAGAMKNALKIKQLNPQANIHILFRDIRTYGFQERYYRQALEQGVIFVRYDDSRLPQVTANGQLKVRFWEPALAEEILVQPDLLILNTGIVAAEGAQELASTLKVPCGLDNFFLEAHIKLRPVDFVTEGIFMAGSAHYPKFLEESIVQAQAAAARAATILSQETLSAGGVVATVNAEKCTGCITCVRVCPYHVPVIDPSQRGAGGILGAAQIEMAACQGCGICAAECPAKAIQLMHYTDAQVMAEEKALFEKVPAT
ncbi:MAG: 4Fe-4S ferredoxin [Chloroflexi bacterium B3_Chlor]|nr:MAG: 4Fe-4S ferredoxin [Chloroflexi bacterium B3_Chlor]